MPGTARTKEAVIGFRMDGTPHKVPYHTDTRQVAPACFRGHLRAMKKAFRTNVFIKQFVRGCMRPPQEVSCI